jgi:hypothetical protein
MGMPGVTSQDYDDLQGLQRIFEMYYSQPNAPILLVVINNRDLLRYVSSLKRVYSET